MLTMNPYLNFQDKTEEAFNFYKSIFGGEFATVMKAKDTPMAETIPANERNRIMHMALPIGKGSILMGSDIFESMGHTLKPGNNFYIAINPDSKEESDKVFKGLSAGGKVTMALADAFWGAYFGMCVDKFGIQWMVNYTYPQQK